MPDSDETEFVTAACQGKVAQVIDDLAAAVAAAGLTVFARIDHGANAAEAGIELRPTELLIFGNPRAGTVLMLDRQTAGIELPFKALAWEDEAGQVWLTYPEPAAIARRHGLSERSEPVLNLISDGMKTVVQTLTHPSRA